jgi:hypothetical protein
MSISIAVGTTEGVASSNSGKNKKVAYLQDPADWIRYYDKTPPRQSFVSTPSISASLADNKSKQTLLIPDLKEEETPALTSNITGSDMQDVELVSPVQGAVQQARAEYVRAPSIKRRKRSRSQSKKRKRHTRKQVRKKKKKRRKPVKKRVKRKAAIKKRKYRRNKKKKKRDIFNE